MKVFLSAVVAAFWLALVPASSAHSPFDCSTRVYLHPDSVEVGITVGMELGEQLLAVASISPGSLPAGRPVSMSVTMLTNFFDVTGDGIVLNPRAADVAAGGMEYLFRFEFALPSARALGFQGHFLPLLRSPRASALVMTDENGNILASAILSEDKATAEFTLKTALPPVPDKVADGQLHRVETNLLPATPAQEPATPNRPTFGEFFRLGVEHILSGYDHLLFLIALLLGCRGVKTMLWVITGFTLAHSLTLALAALNVMVISPRIVEPAIALSILFVAAENFRRSEKSWQRYALTCGFGLIHGFGFAGALRESGLGGTGVEIARPLLAFNLGVETGQLCVAAVVLPLLFWLRKIPAFEKHGPRLISALVILVAAFWLWQRLRW